MPQYVPRTAIEVNSIDSDGGILQIDTARCKQRCCALTTLLGKVCLMITSYKDLVLMWKTCKVVSNEPFTLPNIRNLFTITQMYLISFKLITDDNYQSLTLFCHKL